MKTIGILFGTEDTFPSALVERIHSLSNEVNAEFVSIGVTTMAQLSSYTVVIDRISHEIPYYRSCLKNAMLTGTTVINNPFWWSADDKFFNYALATRLGVAVPRTVLIPSRAHPPGTTSESMRNLQYPLDWHKVFEYIGFPAYLKPHMGSRWKNVYKVHDETEFFTCYHQTGDLVMTLQESIDCDEYVRCYCVGQEKVCVMRYDPCQPKGHRYMGDATPPDPALHQRIIEDCLKLNRALGYDLNMVEFAIRSGVPYAIDFLNPAPDAEYNSVGPENFEWVVNAVAEFALHKALNPLTREVEYRWAHFLGARPPSRSGDTVRVSLPRPARGEMGFNLLVSEEVGEEMKP